jgi:hypothetical protein
MLENRISASMERKGNLVNRVDPDGMGKQRVHGFL